MLMGLALDMGRGRQRSRYRRGVGLVFRGRTNRDCSCLFLSLPVRPRLPHLCELPSNLLPARASVAAIAVSRQIRTSTKPGGQGLPAAACSTSAECNQRVYLAM